jgi:hypothetical protein
LAAGRADPAMSAAVIAVHGQYRFLQAELGPDEHN